MDIMHVFPWVMMLSMFSYFSFLYCSAGTFVKIGMQCSHHVLCSFFVSISFIFIWIGCAWNVAVYPDKLIEELNSRPTVEVFLTHLQDKFPKFWDTVFGDLEQGLFEFWNAQWVMVSAVASMILYEMMVFFLKKPQRQLVQADAEEQAAAQEARAREQARAQEEQARAQEEQARAQERGLVAADVADNRTDSGGQRRGPRGCVMETDSDWVCI
jgi:hypothetical protein